MKLPYSVIFWQGFANLVILGQITQKNFLPIFNFQVVMSASHLDISSLCAHTLTVLLYWYL